MKTVAVSLSLLLLAACVPGGPGSISVEQSRFDDRRYVRAEPGWVDSLDSGVMDSLLGGPFKVGAMVHSELGTLLIVRVDEITRITEVGVRVGEDIYKLKKLGLTEIETSFDDAYDIANSEAGFYIDRSVLERMTSGGETAWIRVTTGKGYLEGDFGKTCASRWPDRACIAVRNMLTEASRLGLSGRRT